MAGAVVLGVLGGGGAGYAVQSARKPTPLPPLSVAQPKYPAARAAAPVLTAAQDDQVKTDGDLTALLVPAPAGAKPYLQDTDTTHAWLNLGEFAETFRNPDVGFTTLAGEHFRRTAEASWYKGPESTTVYLVQFSHADETSALTELTTQEGYGAGDTGGAAVPVPNTSNGQVFPGRKNQAGSGEDAYYQGRGYALHGDIAVEVFLYSAHPVSQQALVALVQSQLERL